MTEKKTCVTCLDYIKPTKEHPNGDCKRAEEENLCWACSRSIHNPATGCLIEIMKEYENSPEAKAEKARLEAKRAKMEAKAKALANQPIVKLKCLECGAIKELKQEEYTDKRRIRKYGEDINKPTDWCEKCWNFTQHKWEV